MYEYQAVVTNVVDGDTIDINIDLGFHITVAQRCRFRGINCPEVHGASKPKGLVAKDFTAAWLKATNNEIIIRTKKPYADDKYGRFLVEIYPTIKAGGAKVASVQPLDETLNQALLRTGNAVPFMTED